MQAWEFSILHLIINFNYALLYTIMYFLSAQS